MILFALILKLGVLFILFELWNAMLSEGFNVAGVIAAIFLFAFVMWPVGSKT